MRATRDPALLSPAERLEEIAALLVTAVRRLRTRPAASIAAPGAPDLAPDSVTAGLEVGAETSPSGAAG
jgi:hypothetical protein